MIKVWVWGNKFYFNSIFLSVLFVYLKREGGEDMGRDQSKNLYTCMYSQWAQTILWRRPELGQGLGGEGQSRVGGLEDIYNTVNNYIYIHTHTLTC